VLRIEQRTRQANQPVPQAGLALRVASILSRRRVHRKENTV
jgi:hypothetical protein